MRAEFAQGALIASLAAGPMLIGPFMILSMIFDAQPDPSAWLGMPLILLLSTLFGFAIALIPNFVGAATLTWAGSRHLVFRNPAVWAASGFALGSLLAAAVAGELSGGITIIGADGLLCALICRRFTTWSD